MRTEPRNEGVVSPSLADAVPVERYTDIRDIDGDGAVTSKEAARAIDSDAAPDSGPSALSSSRDGLADADGGAPSLAMITCASPRQPRQHSCTRESRHRTAHARTHTHTWNTRPQEKRPSASASPMSKSSVCGESSCSSALRCTAVAPV